MRNERGEIGTMGLIILGIVSSVFLIGSLAMYVTGQDLELRKPTGSSPTALAVGDSCLGPLLPGVSDQAVFAQALDTYIKQLKPSSPMVGTGLDFVKAGIQNGLNPAWVIAIAQKESQFGTAGFAAEEANNAFGRTATDAQPHIVSPTGRKWYKYTSFSQSAYGQSEYLKRRYIDQGLTTLEEITYTYAPPSENATDAYIQDIKKWIAKIVALAGGSVSCGSAVATTQSSTPGSDVGRCENVREIPRSIPAKHNRLAHTTLVLKLEELYKKNTSWRVTEACPPVSRHQSRNHYNGRAVDIAIDKTRFPNPSEAQINQLLQDAREIGFSYIKDEYREDTQFKTGGHLHLEWRGQ